MKHTPKNKNNLIKILKNTHSNLGDIDISNIASSMHLFKKAN
ncbi:hypothetical protein UXU46_00345 (plasmid) [Campylobacter jejuni]